MFKQQQTGKPTIYEQHDAAFANVAAFVIAKDGEKVATIAFKLPRDGASRLYAYVHWLGVAMVRGYAGGYGYDKRSAACSDAAGKMIKLPRDPDESRGVGFHAFRMALFADDGDDWDRRLRDAGFDVLRAV
jgi:hypothetical protein